MENAYIVTQAQMDNLARAIQNKANDPTLKYTIDTMPAAIKSISSETIVVDGTDDRDGTITPFTVLEGEVGYAQGERIIGQIVRQYGEDTVLDPGGSYNIYDGYYDSSFVISTKSLEEITPATATSADIREGTTAWVNGVEIVGDMPTVEVTTNDLSSSLTIDGNKVLLQAHYNRDTNGYTEAHQYSSEQIEEPSIIVFSNQEQGTYDNPFIPRQTFQQVCYGDDKRYLLPSEGIYIAGDENLAPDNIKAGTSIFGVTGTLRTPALIRDVTIVVLNDNERSSTTDFCGYGCYDTFMGGWCSLPRQYDSFTIEEIRMDNQFWQSGEFEVMSIEMDTDSTTTSDCTFTLRIPNANLQSGHYYSLTLWIWAYAADL